MERATHRALPVLAIPAVSCLLRCFADIDSRDLFSSNPGNGLGLSRVAAVAVSVGLASTWWTTGPISNADFGSGRPRCREASHAGEPHSLAKGESDDWTLRRELMPDEIFGKDSCRKAHGVAHGAMVVILCPRGKDEIREREGEYRHAEEERIGDPLHVVFGLPLILRRSRPFANDVSEQPVFLHVAGSLASSCRAPHRLTRGRESSVGLPITRRCNGRASSGLCSARRFTTPQ